LKTLKNDLKNNPEFIEEWDWITARPTGRAVERELAHKKGIPHEGVHLWIVKTIPDTSLLFQHRAKNKELFPDCLDITVGGHVPFGKHTNKIQKESYEEIGIFPKDEELTDLGYFRYEEKVGDIIYREFQQVFILIDNRPLNRYKFIDGEVDAIFAVKINDLKTLFKKDFSFLVEGFKNKAGYPVQRGKKYDDIPDTVENSLNDIIKKEVSRKDFHPLLFTQPMKEYIKIVIQAAIDLASGKTPAVKMPPII
jgi:isopentenyldiphosphate isomerase